MWQKGKPNKPGYYWVRCGQKAPFIIKVKMLTDSPELVYLEVGSTAICKVRLSDIDSFRGPLDSELLESCGIVIK